MVRHTLRKLAVTVLAAGCVLAGPTAASASSSSGGGRPNDSPCAAAPPVPALPPGDPDPDLLWPQQKLDLSQAGVWYLSRGKGVTVAVVDTGVDPADPAFARDTVLPGASVADPGGSADYDCDGQGTAVAAIVAGKENGPFGFTGVAPEAQILPIRQSDDAGRAGGAEQLADAILTATAAGARIVDISAGVPEDSSALHAAVQNALAADVLIVAAVGPGPKSYPAAIPGVLAVGSSDADGSPSAPAQASGASVLGPGGRMAVPAEGYSDGLTAMQGTDLAAGYVSGVAALIRSYRPDLHNWEVVRRLEETADPPVTKSPAAGAPNTPETLNTPAASSASATPNPVTGYGVVDSYRAVSEDLPDEARPDPSIGPAAVVSPADAAVPGHDRGASRLALGVSAAGVLMLAAPVAMVATRRGRMKGPRAGV